MKRWTFMTFPSLWLHFCLWIWMMGNPPPASHRRIQAPLSLWGDGLSASRTSPTIDVHRHGRYFYSTKDVPAKQQPPEFWFDQNTNRIKNAIIRANNAMASVRANPKIAYPNNCFANDGFRATEWIKELKTLPIPTAAPANAIVAAPAPINLAPSNTYRTQIKLLRLFYDFTMKKENKVQVGGPRIQ